MLSTVLENPQKEYIVYTDQKGISKLFRELAIDNSITLEYGSASCFRDVGVIKQKMLSQLSRYRIDSITFYHTEFGEFANWLISRYSQETEIFFQPPYKTWDIAPSYDFLSLKLKAWTFLKFGYKADILKVGSKRYISMSRSFYKKNRVIQIKSAVDHSCISSFINSKYPGYKHKSVVWLDGAIIAGGIDPDGYKDITNIILSRIGTERVLSKCHPRFDDLYGLENDLEQIPSYIPISLLINCFDIYIGYWSTALVEAAIAGKIAISTIFIMPQTQEGRIEVEKRVLDDKLEGKGIIYYPNTIDDLITIIENNDS